jgi:hypothetical protein
MNIIKAQRPKTNTLIAWDNSSDTTSRINDMIITSRDQAHVEDSLTSNKMLYRR